MVLFFFSFLLGISLYHHLLCAAIISSTDGVPTLSESLETSCLLRETISVLPCWGVCLTPHCFQMNAGVKAWNLLLCSAWSFLCLCVDAKYKSWENATLIHYWRKQKLLYPTWNVIRSLKKCPSLFIQYDNIWSTTLRKYLETEIIRMNRNMTSNLNTFRRWMIN